MKTRDELEYCVSCLHATMNKKDGFVHCVKHKVRTTLTGTCECFERYVLPLAPIEGTEEKE